MSQRASYPVIGLSKAVEYLNKLWKDAQHAPLTIEAAAKSIGYKAVSGPSRGRLAALKHYGLTEEAGKELLRISALAKIIAVHPEGKEREDALRQAGRNPKLFKELIPTYVAASDGVLRGFLITNKGYSEDAAKLAIKAFRDTVSFAKLSESPLNPDKEDDTMDSGEDEYEDGGGDAADSAKKKNRLPSEKEFVDEVSFKLSPNSKVEIVFTSDKPTTQEDFDLMMKMLDIQKMAFPKAADLPKEPHWTDNFFNNTLSQKPPVPKTQKQSFPRPATWKNKDHDQPVMVTGRAGLENGKLYYMIEGSETGISEDELEFDGGEVGNG